MNLNFKISPKEDTSMSRLLKWMCALKCRSQVNIVEGYLIIEGIVAEKVENAIDVICDFFEVECVEIIPMDEIHGIQGVAEQTEIMPDCQSQNTDVVTSEQISDGGVTEIPKEGNSAGGVEETTTFDSHAPNMCEDESSNNTKKPSAEEYLERIFASSLEELDNSRSTEEQLENWFKNIGFQSKQKIIKGAFIAACKVKKVSYDSIILELSKAYPSIREDIIKSSMRDEFNRWLTLHPEIKAQYPRISFMVLLKVFAKKMR